MSDITLTKDNTWGVLSKIRFLCSQQKNCEHCPLSEICFYDWRNATDKELEKYARIIDKTADEGGQNSDKS